jgi:predicted secreted protein
MKIGTAIAIYFVVWWIVLFAVLPWGVKNAHEAGESTLEGNEPGAPVRHQMGKKALITTVVACVVFAIIYFSIQYFWPLITLTSGQNLP